MAGNIRQSQSLRSGGQEQERRKLGKETGMVRSRRMSGVKVIRWILLWVWVGVKTRLVGSGGGRNLSPPRNGAQDRDTSRTTPPKGQHCKMEEEERV